MTRAHSHQILLVHEDVADGRVGGGDLLDEHWLPLVPDTLEAVVFRLWRGLLLQRDVRPGSSRWSQGSSVTVQDTNNGGDNTRAL